MSLTQRIYIFKSKTNNEHLFPRLAAIYLCMTLLLEPMLSINSQFLNEGWNSKCIYTRFWWYGLKDQMKNVNHKTYLAWCLKIVAGEAIRCALNSRNLGITLPSSRYRANHLYLFKSNGISISEGGSSQDLRPTINIFCI